MVTISRTLYPGLLCAVALSASSTALCGAQSLQFSKKHLLVGRHENATVGDVNRDGHVDIVCGPYWFAGPDFVPQAYRPNHLAADYISENSVHLYDVDRDGWDDIIVGAWNSKDANFKHGLHWYKNPGNGPVERKTPWEMHAGWAHRQLATTVGEIEMVAMHDYDRDGVPEFHVTSYRKAKPLEIFRLGKDAQGEIIMTPFLLGKEGAGHGIAFGDVNGDGREDVLTEIGWYERPVGDIWAAPWKLHPETDLSKMHPSCPFVVRDLNGDGRLDIVFGRGHNVGLYWWEQLGMKKDGTTQWQQHVIDESWSQAHCLVWADLDGNGDDDLIAGKCLWAHNGGDPGAGDPPAIYYYTWDKAAGKFTRHTIASTNDGIAINRQFCAVDLNKDGRLDLVAPSKRGLWVFFNQGMK